MISFMTHAHKQTRSFLWLFVKPKPHHATQPHPAINANHKNYMSVASVITPTLTKLIAINRIERFRSIIFTFPNILPMRLRGCPNLLQANTTLSQIHSFLVNTQRNSYSRRDCDCGCASNYHEFETPIRISTHTELTPSFIIDSQRNWNVHSHRYAQKLTFPMRIFSERAGLCRGRGSGLGVWDTCHFRNFLLLSWQKVDRVHAV